MLQATTDLSFTQDVLESELPVLVDFWAPWCSPCHTLEPLINRIAEASVGHAKVFKLNIDENPLTVGDYGVRSIPTIIVFKNGEEAERLVGLQRPEKYLQALDLEIA